MIDRLDPRSGQLRSGLWCYNKLWKPAKTTPKMWRNFVFLQNSLFSWEVFTVISRKILFFWEKCHFEKNPIFLEKDNIFSWFSQYVHSLHYESYSYIFSCITTVFWLQQGAIAKRLEMAQNEKVFCDESLNRRRYRLGVKKTKCSSRRDLLDEPTRSVVAVLRATL